MHGKNQLSSPFKSAFRDSLPMKKDDADDLYDKNPCSYLSHPHDMGPDTIPLVFEEGVLGKRYHLADIQANSASISTAMSGQKK